MKLKFVLIMVALLNLALGKTLKPFETGGKTFVLIKSRMEEDQAFFDEEFYSSNDKSESNPTDFEEVEELLWWFLFRLRSFILESQFKFSEFEKRIDRLQKDFLSVKELMEGLNPKSPDLLKEFRFAEYMFENMAASVQSTKTYNYWGSKTDYLIISIIEFNVGLLRFFDDHGEVNPMLWGYADKVISSSKNVSTWSKEFESLAGVSEESRVLFEQQRSKAKRVINILERHIPQV